MAYIGKQPTTGDFVLLDSITTSATASYTMQKNSVNFEPQSANHMILSLNGTIQAPVSSFTVSGSTLTFASALTSSDVIDFILVLGNVNDVGTATTVVDSAITKNKLNLISESSSAGLTVKGDGSSENGTIQMNCSQNTHGIKLSSPDHSAGQSYELIFPTGNVTADKFLKVASVSGSGTTGIGQLSFDDAGGVYGTEYFAANRTSDFTVTDQTYVKAQINNEIVDIGSNYDTSNYRYTVPTTGYYFFYVRGMVDADSDGQLNAVDFFLKKNNSSYVAETNIDFQNNNGRKGGTTLNAILSLSASDYIEWWIYAKDNAGNPILKANTGAGAGGAGNQFGGWRVA